MDDSVREAALDAYVEGFRAFVDKWHIGAPEGEKQLSMEAFALIYTSAIPPHGFIVDFARELRRQYQERAKAISVGEDMHEHEKRSEKGPTTPPTRNSAGSVDLSAVLRAFEKRLPDEQFRELTSYARDHMGYSFKTHGKLVDWIKGHAQGKTLYGKQLEDIAAILGV